MRKRAWRVMCVAIGLAVGAGLSGYRALMPTHRLSASARPFTAPIHLPIVAPAATYPMPISFLTQSTSDFGVGAKLPGPAPAIPAAPVAAQADAPAGVVPTGLVQPITLSAQPDDESVYAMPTPAKEGEGVNAGGVKLDLTMLYLNQNVYRGISHSIKSSGPPAGSGVNAEPKGTSANFNLDARLEFDLGKFPHPFVGVVGNMYDSDPVSRFQEVRPIVGATWNIRPITLEGGNISYFYPEREDLNTAEFYGKISLDDSFLFHTQHPLLSPYAFGAYDYDKNKGWYFEAGVTHDFVFEDWGLTLTVFGDAAYIMGFQQQFVYIDDPSTTGFHTTGFQHYDVGAKAAYSLNALLNIPKRYGEFDLVGNLTYTDGLSSNIRADTVLWGGGGIQFKY
jgi:hypothetical protein